MHMEETKEYEDKDLVCLCGERFVWTMGEQKFLDDLLASGKVDEVKQPKRCKPCRLKKREERK